MDLNTKVWTIPAARMKAKREHRVPMTARAFQIVTDMREATDGEVLSAAPVFAGLKRAKPLSNMAFLMLLLRMGRDDLTAHGFRSTFRDWAAESTNYPSELSEMALAHVVSNKVEAAYRRGDLFEKRRKLMSAWATFCNAPVLDAKVIPIGRSGL